MAANTESTNTHTRVFYLLLVAAVVAGLAGLIIAIIGTMSPFPFVASCACSAYAVHLRRTGRA